MLRDQLESKSLQIPGKLSNFRMKILTKIPLALGALADT